jgi:pyruvate decarboxylase
MQLAEYLFARLHQLGVRDVLGVPGDFNLALLDYVVPAGLNWIGNCNELNAGYGADGYARVLGLSAFVTTFGVGELSAINAVAGAFAERAPVVHIVGKPSTQLQAQRALTHHTFIDGDFEHFARMAKEVTVAQVDLCDPSTAADLIDHALQQCLLHSRPVYIQVPTDQLEVEVDDGRLKQPITTVMSNGISQEAESGMAKDALDRIYAANTVLFYIDGETRSMGIADEVQKLVRNTGLPAFTSAFGKGLVDETLPNCYGVYATEAGPVDHSDFFTQCELVLCFGPHFSNTNTYIRKTVPESTRTIFFTPKGIQFPDQKCRDISAAATKSIIHAIASEFTPSKLASPSLLEPLKPKSIRQDPTSNGSSAPLTQPDLYTAIQPLLRPGDVVLGETGTAAYQTREMKLPSGCTYFGATTWLSIGYMLPATLGAALARRALAADHTDADSPADSNTRCILFTGDGSLQMTVQEISTMIAQDLDIVIFVINNGGYTIERCLHGWRAHYNDIHNWRYDEAASFFGAPEGKRKGWKATTVGELQTVLEEPKVMEGKGVRVVEIVLDKEDASETLMRLTSRPPPKDVEMGEEDEARSRKRAREEDA